MPLREATTGLQARVNVDMRLHPEVHLLLPQGGSLRRRGSCLLARRCVAGVWEIPPEGICTPASCQSKPSIDDAFFPECEGAEHYFSSSIALSLWLLITVLSAWKIRNKDIKSKNEIFQSYIFGRDSSATTGLTI